MRFLLLMAAVLMAGCGSEKPAAKESIKEPLHAPGVFTATMDTTKGPIMIEVHRDWAPRAADRFYELINEKFYNGVKFHRVMRGFVAQFGVNKDPKIQELWRQMKMNDDPVIQKNVRGTITFAARGPASRTTQMFINLRDNRLLDKDGFAPFGKVVEGMDVADKLTFLYGELAPAGGGPEAQRMETEGNVYLDRFFPRLDAINTITVEK